MSNLASILIKINADGTDAEKKFQTFEKRVKSLSASMADTGKSLSKWITVPMTAIAAVSVRNANIQQQAEARLLNALRGRADVQQRLIKYAGEMQARSTLGDEAIIAQQAFLASLGLTEQQIIDTTEAAVQLSYATGMSLESAVKNLAKTYGGLSGELGESIPQLKTLTKEQMMQGAAVKFVNDNYKGFAETAAKTGAGTLTQLKNQLGDLAEQIGFILMPIIQKIVGWLKTLATWLQNLSPTTQKVIVVIGGLAATAGPLLIVFSKIASAIPVVVTNIKILGAAFTSATGPIGVIITALGALATAFMSVKDKAAATQQAIIDAKNTALAEFKDDVRQEYAGKDDDYLRGQISVYRDTYFSDLDAFGGDRDETAKNPQQNEVLNFSAARVNIAKELLATRERERAEAKALEEQTRKTIEAQMAQMQSANTEIRQADGLIGQLQTRIRALEESMPWLRTRDEIIATQREIAILQNQLDNLQSSYEAMSKPVTAENADLGGLDLGKVQPVEFDPAVVAGRAAIEKGATESTSALRAWGQQVIDVSSAVGEAVAKAVEDMLVGFGEALGDLMSGEDFNPLESLLKVLGNALQQMGKMLIKAGLMAESIRESIKTIFANPFVAIAAGVAAIALGKMLSNMSQKTVALAKGGLAFGPTLALVGDNPSAASDPEVIAPLSKLRGMLNTSGTRISFEGAEFTISGDQLRAVLNRDAIRVNALG